MWIAVVTCESCAAASIWVMESGPPATSDLDMLCPYAWAAPIQALNCGVVGPPGLDNPQLATRDTDGVEVEFDEVGTWAGTWAAGRAPRKEYLELDTPEYSGKLQADDPGQ